MNKFFKFFLPFILPLSSSAYTIPSTTTVIPPTSSSSSSSNETSEYLLNLGWYMGYDLASNPNATTPSTVPSTTTPDITDVTDTQFSAAASYLSAIPLIVDTSTNVTLAPSSVASLDASPYNTIYSALTTLPASPYSVWSNFTAPSQTQTAAIAGVDQPTYQVDPTSQAIASILTRPDFTFCTGDNMNDTSIASPCTNAYNPTANLYDLQYLANILGDTAVVANSAVTYGSAIPSVSTVISPTYNQPLIPQLNANTLLAPLMYNTTPPSSDSSGSTTSLPGYPAQTQETQAAAFVHYLSGQDQLGQIADFQTYNTMYNNLSTTGTIATQAGAVEAFYSYFMNLRQYLAHESVGISNLNIMQGKRMLNTATNSSQALDEYTMATRRVLDPISSTGSSSTSSSASNEWITSMQSASPIVLQREMLYLLSEINYQMYLQRMQDERILLTLTAMQLGGSAFMLKNNAQLVTPSTT